jgi:hypothetical protein
MAAFVRGYGLWVILLVLWWFGIIIIRMATEWPAVWCLGWPCWVNREIVLETDTCGRKGERAVGSVDSSAEIQFYIVGSRNC